MSDTTKHALPEQWSAVADCVDAYEIEHGGSFPDLRHYAQRAPSPQRVAALAELVKVDIERRWANGQQRRVEDYLQEYPELSGSGPLSEELAQQEFLVRSRHGHTPSSDEFHSRFPSIDVQKLPQGEQAMVLTMNFGASPLETQILDSKPRSSSTASPTARAARAVPTLDTNAGTSPDHSGTVDFDTARKSSSTAGSSRSAASSVSAAPPAPAEAPKAIGRYTIKQELGSGSFGLVYRCFDEDLKRDVAIKVPHLRAKITQERIKEFLHEAQSAARLRHSGIVTVMDTSQTEDGRAFIVYEFIAGRTLQNHLEEGKYTIADAVRWLAETAEALHHAHKNSIVHRDIKPANILVDPDGRTHIADFGLAKMDDQFFKNDTGKVLGTVAYMSPEQAAGQSHWATPQTDIYSLGVMLYQMLTRRLPFVARELDEVLLQIRERTPAPPRTIDDKIPKAVEDVCLKAMAKNPAERYTTAADMAADLRAALAEQPPARRTPGTTAAAAAAAAAGLLAFMVWAPWREKESQSPTAHRPGATNNTATAINSSGGVADLPAGAPRLEIHFQGAGEQGVYHPLSGKPLALHEGDKVQLHVELGEPRYVYLYWYDAAGKPNRLWPENVDRQQKLSRVSSPAGEDNWHIIDANVGAEMAIVAASDRPLSAGDLAEFEAQSPHTGDALRLQEVFQLASADVERGLGGIVKSQKNPLAAQFRETLKNNFDSFHGLVIPHE